MIDPTSIEKNPEDFIEILKKRGIPEAKAMIEDFISTNRARKKAQQGRQNLAEEINHAQRQINQLFKENPEKGRAMATEIGEKKVALKKQDGILKEIEAEWRAKALAFPNILHERVPIGDERHNRVVGYGSGGQATMATEGTPHWELLSDYDLVDFQMGVKVTGRGFPIYKGQGAKLRRALIDYFLDAAIATGFQEVAPPLVVNQKSAEGTGQLPDKEGIMYHLSSDDLYLIPTAEVPVTNLYRESILNADQFPLRHVAYTPCFRREAGSWGRDVRGLNRLHQFDKVELVEMHLDKNSAEKALDAMVEHVKKLLEDLHLPYRVLCLSSGDLGWSSSLTYDLEVWSPGQGRWLEVSSVSYFGTYQGRRMGLRYRKKSEKKEEICHAHTINGSGLALPRIMAALLEHGAKAEHIRLPASLHPYMGSDRIIKKEGLPEKG